jgi:hypothetical protein
LEPFKSNFNILKINTSKSTSKRKRSREIVFPRLLKIVLKLRDSYLSSISLSKITMLLKMIK